MGSKADQSDPRQIEMLTQVRFTSKYELKWAIKCWAFFVHRKHYKHEMIALVYAALVHHLKVVDMVQKTSLEGKKEESIFPKCTSFIPSRHETRAAET